MVLLELQAMQAHVEDGVKFISYPSAVDFDCVSTFSVFC
jgi:hypothetical protein